MPTSRSEETEIAHIAERHGIAPEVALAMLAALRNGPEARPELNQLQSGERVNRGLKAKLDALGADLTAYLRTAAADGDSA